MEIAKEKSVNSFKFNFKVLTVNDKPLEFCVEGYQLEEFLGITKIIEAFGGKVSSSHASNVIIFSGPNDSMRLSSDCYYDIKFLRDSVATGKLQNLKKYRIRSSKTLELERSAIQHRRTIEKQKENNINSYEGVGEPSGSKIFDIKTNFEKDNAKKIGKSLKSCSRPVTGCSGSSSGQGDMMKLWVMIPKLREQIVNSVASNEEWKKHEVPTSSKQSVKTTDRKALMDDDDISEISESQIDNDESSLLLSSNKKLNNEPCEIQLPQEEPKLERVNLGSFFYTKRDDRRMIEYLIKKNALHVGKKESTWKEFLNNEVLDKHNPSIASLAQHFRTILSDCHINHAKNAATARPCEPVYKDTIKKSRMSIPYSEMEYKVMINFLIDNDLFNYASGTTIWKRCLENSPLLQKSGRTMYSLREKFRKYLRYHYAKYTNDPEALKRFKELEHRRRQRIFD